MATYLGISKYQGMCTRSPWNQGKACPHLRRGLREKSSIHQGSLLTLHVLQAVKFKLPGSYSSSLPLLPLIWYLGRESTDMATYMLLVFLGCGWKWPAGRVARALVKTLTLEASYRNLVFATITWLWISSRVLHWLLR